MKKPIRVITQRSQSLEQYARDRKCATKMAELLKEYCWWEHARGAGGGIHWRRLIYLEDGIKICEIFFPISSDFVTNVISSGDTPILPLLKRGRGVTLEKRSGLNFSKGEMNDTKPTWFGPKITNANLKSGSLATWETRYTPNYLKGVINDLKKVRGNKSAGDEKNDVVPVLQEQGNPCGDCPFRHGRVAGANSLREAFKAVSKRAAKRNKKTGEVK